MASRASVWIALGVLLIAGLVPVAAASLAGTVDDVDEAASQDDRPASQQAGPMATEGSASEPWSRGEYEAARGIEVTLESFDGTELALGIFRPEIPGCDWEADRLPAECQLPVVVHASPYFGGAVEEASGQPPLVEWLVPRGYAVVQMALRGTGESGGCFEFKNPEDIRDVEATLDHLVDASWTSGQLGMVGFSYAGTAAWAGAASGHANLETVVPISAAVDAPDLYYKNGTADYRGPVTPLGYYPYAIGPTGVDVHTDLGAWTADVCQEQTKDWSQALSTTVTGDAGSAYWQARDLTGDVLERYDGSAWVIHGLQDRNVNPSQVVPFTRELRDSGLETRVWLGQWGHAVPDDYADHWNARWDFAEELVTWLDHYLKDQGETPDLDVEVENSRYRWRTVEAYPPQLDGWQELMTQGRSIDWGTRWSHDFGPFEEPVRINGLPRLHFEATPYSTQGGYVFAQLYDVYPDGTTTTLGWAVMDLRYHQGGNTDPEVLVPGQRIDVQMEFEPTDALIKPDHELRLVVFRDSMEGMTANPDPTPVVIGQTTLSLPVS